MQARPVPARAFALAAVASALLVAAAGCITQKDLDDSQKLLDTARQAGEIPEDLVFTMAVTAARVAPGRCMDGATEFGRACHTLNVTIDLRNATVDLPLDQRWKAFTAEGLGVPSYGATGQVARGGRLSEVQLRFETDGAAVRLVELRHTGAWQSRLTIAAVPAY